MQRILVLLLAAATLTPSFAGIRGRVRPSSPPPPQCLPANSAITLSADAAPAVLVADKKWGSIKGRITWGGAIVPNMAPINLGGPQAPCLKANNGLPPFDETWVVHKGNKGIRDSFVWLVDANKKSLPIKDSLKEIKVQVIALDLPACHFAPHVLALREGQILKVKNSAPFAHNFKYTGSPETDNNGNLLLPANAMQNIKVEASRMPVVFECNIHPWMKGWLRVFDHPYYAVTDENGAFEINDAPAGNWRLMIWHASAGWKGGAEGRNGHPVTVDGGKTRDLGAIASYP